MSEEFPDTARGRVVRGLQEALHGNVTAFGYSVTITASYGAVQNQQGNPALFDLLLYGIGAVAAFSVLEGILSRGFRQPLPRGSDEVRTLGTALAFLSIAMAIATASAIASLLGGGVAWFASAVGASLVFVLAEGLEFAVAAWLQQRRGEHVS